MGELHGDMVEMRWTIALSIMFMFELEWHKHASNPQHIRYWHPTSHVVVASYKYVCIA